MHPVRAKKHLGQHFLNDANIARDIAECLTGHGGYKRLLEIGPGTGVLTQHLLNDTRFDLYVAEIDTESVDYLKKNYTQLAGKIIEGDFLQMDLNAFNNGQPIGIIGNFPYNISSQILFKVYDEKHLVTECAGMFQKEVAKRIASPPGNKDYGILSVLLQAFYDIEYLFDVPPTVFIPPPKVDSGVIRLVRNNVEKLDCDEKLFKTVIKLAFNQRRKMLRNGLSSLAKGREHRLFTQRAEQLSVAEFVERTNFLQEEQ
jgi:16S rRNA (adenine1518-N6/adenine1519-N6)-dimethyltransferase